MNGILVIDKDKNMTSRDVVNEVCKKLNTRHIGHTGTLDPLATGVLVLGINDGCKIIDLLTCDSKVYEAEITLGIKTDTLDITGEIIDKEDTSKITIDDIKKVIDNFPKKYMQTVPKYSAVHVDGKRLYEYARNNIDVELPKREVEIYSLELISDLEDNKFSIRTRVSKGTYIRSLIEDIGKNLGVCATMSNLRRTNQGIFNIDMAYKLDDINDNIKLISIKESLKKYDNIIVDREIEKKVLNGMILEFDTNSSLILILNEDKKLLAIYKRYEKDNTKMKPYKVFKENI